jgi:hypothetical protein
VFSYTGPASTLAENPALAGDASRLTLPANSINVIELGTSPSP